MEGWLVLISLDWEKNSWNIILWSKIPSVKDGVISFWLVPVVSKKESLYVGFLFTWVRGEIHVFKMNFFLWLHQLNILKSLVSDICLFFHNHSRPWLYSCLNLQKRDMSHSSRPGVSLILITAINFTPIKCHLMHATIESEWWWWWKQW